ncbi:MAG: sugar phosphate isomerase/epimerase [Propionibacteriaceae bacterium]|nr:sugar phosphate isomerase/epimerase [Propionibacteriaceae bacterium]
MLPYPGVQPDGSSTQDAPADAWYGVLNEVRSLGFTEVDPTDSWLRIADLAPSRLDEFSDIVKRLGFTIPAITTARRSIIDPEFADENLAYSHRVLDVAPKVGAKVVSFGLLPRFMPAQLDALWFWEQPGYSDPDDKAVWDLCVARFRELGDHAASLGLEIALEMYEDTYLGTADDSVRLVTDIDHPAVGLNPDLGNLIRLHRPIEAWRSMFAKVVPYAKYWHVKNYFRMEDPASGIILTSPAPLESGMMSYRLAVADALEAGFNGAFCVEHYGGDGLGVCASNRDYLRSVLRRCGLGSRQ